LGQAQPTWHPRQFRGGSGVESTHPPLPKGAKPEHSRCYDIPGYTTIDGSPIRTPLAVADYLIDELKGKPLTEIGTRNGDILKCVSEFSPVKSVEIDQEYCNKLEARGLPVICKSITDLEEDELPVSDYYFWWPMAAATQNEEWVRHISRILKSKGVAAGKTAIIACDMSWQEDIDNSYHMRDKFGGVWKGKVFFDEGMDDRMFGAFRMIHVPLDFEEDVPDESAPGGEHDSNSDES